MKRIILWILFGAIALGLLGLDLAGPQRLTKARDEGVSVILKRITQGTWKTPRFLLRHYKVRLVDRLLRGGDHLRLIPHWLVAHQT